MSRLVLVSLAILASVAAAQDADLELVRFGKDVYLDGAPLDGAPVVSIHDMRAAGVGVVLNLEFRFGLYAIGRGGREEPAVGGLRLEYQPLDGEGGERRPAAFQPGENPHWTDRPEGDAAEPMQDEGYWFTHAASVYPLERRLVFLFPKEGRYRLYVSGLFGHSALERRVPSLLAVEEIRVVPPPVAEEQEVVEEEVVEEFTACPFCEGPLMPVIWSGTRPCYYNCRRCSGEIDCRPGRKPRGTVRQGGRRREYGLESGRPVRAARGVAPPPGMVRPGLRAPRGERRPARPAGSRRSARE